MITLKQLKNADAQFFLDNPKLINETILGSDMVRRAFGKAKKFLNEANIAKFKNEAERRNSNIDLSAGGFGNRPGYNKTKEDALKDYNAVLANINKRDFLPNAINNFIGGIERQQFGSQTITDAADLFQNAGDTTRTNKGQKDGLAEMDRIKKQFASAGLDITSFDKFKNFQDIFSGGDKFTLDANGQVISKSEVNKPLQPSGVNENSPEVKAEFARLQEQGLSFADARKQALANVQGGQEGTTTPTTGFGQFVPSGTTDAPDATGGASVGSFIPGKGSPDAQGVFADGTGGTTGGGTNIFDTLIANNPLIQEYLSDPANRANFDSLDDTLKMAWITSQNSIQASIEAGKPINNQLDLSNPAIMKRFIDDAKVSLDPHFKEQFRQYEQDLGSSLQRMDDDFQKSIRRGEDVFKRGLADQAENEAQSGTAFGSERGTRINQRVDETQQAIDDSTTNLLRNKQDIGRNAERTLGSDAFGKFQGQFGANQFNVSQSGFANTGSRNLFNPQDNILGTLPGQREVAINTEANRLGAVENEQLRLSQRKLNF